MIERIQNENQFDDILMNCRWQTKVHEHGLVALVDVMPRLVPKGKTCDYAIVQAARVSYGEGTKTINEDEGLIRYLMRHSHTTPLEMVELKLHCVMPIFVARQWIRHRTANVNEYSARYSIVKDRFYRPPIDGVREQSNKNKQGGDELVGEGTAIDFLNWLKHTEEQYGEYEKFTEAGVSRELARIGLPTSVYTEWYWKIDLHNLFHFLRLRMDNHAQQEIRDYANAMFDMVREIAPIASQAFLDYKFNSITLSALEVEAIKGMRNIASTNKREQEEFEAKRRKLGEL
jgi:thymidylate synthase (FAD)